MSLRIDHPKEFDTSCIPLWDMLHCDIMNLAGTLGISRIIPEVDTEYLEPQSHLYHIKRKELPPVVVEAKKYYAMPNSVAVTTHAFIQQYPEGFSDRILHILLKDFSQKNKQVLPRFVEFSRFDLIFPNSITAIRQAYLLEQRNLDRVMESITLTFQNHEQLIALWSDYITTTVDLT